MQEDSIHSYPMQKICDRFGLGACKGSPLRIQGGLIHTMWRLETTKAVFAVKELSNEILFADKHSIKNFELTERVASSFAHAGVPAISAKEKFGKFVTKIDKSGFVVYPWFSARTLGRGEVSKKHALKIATVLAKIHTFDMRKPRGIRSAFCKFSKQKLLALISKAEYFNCSFAQDLTESRDNVLDAIDAYHNAVPGLQSPLVVSHCDLDQKNVLWDVNDNPTLIDWESAALINPTYDAMRTAFSWSGISSHFNQELFFDMLEAYQKCGGIIDPACSVAACYGTFSEIGWMMFNIERSCSQAELEQRTLAEQSVREALSFTLQLQTVIPKLVKFFPSTR